MDHIRLRERLKSWVQMSPFEQGEEPELRSAERGYASETGRAKDRTVLGIGEDVRQR